jgi:hypothetical protein
METITFKAPVGTRARLKKLGEISTLMRQQVDRLLNDEQAGFVSAYEKSKHLIIKGGSGIRNAATSKEYLKQYAPKKNR